MPKNNLPLVSAIIPCCNEEKFISKCLDSIVNTDFPKERLEVLVVDGMSKDKTKEIVKKYTVHHPFIKILENQKIITPAAMNTGIKNSKGEIIIKMDAHSIYKKDYISKCVKHLEESGADNVGGVLKTIPAKNTLQARAVAHCLSNSFGVGTAFFRRGVKKPKEVDTVAFGCYRKEIFYKIGLFDERMAKIEDFELNSRIRKTGGKIMLFPDIQAYYYPSSENLRDFFEHNFFDGIWAIYPLKFVKFPLKLRHYFPLIFVLTLPLSILPYILLSLFFSIQIAIKEKDFRYLFLMPIAFACRHFGYGLGSIFGLIKLIF